MAQKVFKYTNGEVTVIWQPELCIHSGRCARGLPEVFKPKEKPWIIPEASTTEKIIAQVKRCPSGALSYVMNNDTRKEKGYLT
ncbi:MAG TPA: (4Fe-4S)-binding protein [Chitinophagaceae bacterium]